MTGLAGRRSLYDERGISLPELLISMMLLSVITAAVVALFSTIGQTFTRDRSATDSTNIAAIGMNEITRVVRSGTEVQITSSTRATAVIDAHAESLEMYAFLDTNSFTPSPIKVRFEVSGARDLIEKRWGATSTAPGLWSFPSSSSTPASTRTIARKITPPTATPAPRPVFQYFDSTDRSATPMTIPGGGFTAAQLKSIVRIEVTLTVQADLTERAKPVEIRNSVGIPNLGVNTLGAATP